MCKRLKMDGHVVKSVENGQEAIDALAADWGFDVVLMDIQMPIMDGRQSAREIRSLEAAGKLPAAAHVGERLAHRLNGRIPIIAVSASLYEEDRADIAVSFDGWLLKPLSESSWGRVWVRCCADIADFPRVRELLKVLQDESGELRAKEMYEAGCWEWGGFFRCG
jgi:CheY-like chemotaxis protein